VAERLLLPNYVMALGCLLVFVSALGVYLLTLAPTVTLVDSGELILACHSLGIAHPPGFPLYVLVGHLFTQLPLGNVAYRLNLMSAFFAALTTLTVFYTVRLISEANRTHPLSLFPPFLSSLFFAFSLTFWSWATVAEVYTLNTFLLSLVICLLLIWKVSSKKQTAGLAGKAWPVRCLGLAAFIYGLALGNHHVTVLLLAPAVLYWLVTTAGWRFLTTKKALLAGALLLLGLSVYLYLPLRAAQNPALNWGDPRTLGKLIWHVTGKQYRVNLFSSSLDHILGQAAYFGQLWLKQFTLVGALLALIGLGRLWQRDRHLLTFTLLIVFFDVLYAVNYDIAEDIEAYYLPTFLMTALWLGPGVAQVLAWVADKIPGFLAVAAVLLALSPLAPLASNYYVNNKSDNYIAYDYAANTLEHVEPGGLLLTRDWQLYSPLLYLQHVEGMRPDVAVMDTELLRRSWYYLYLQEQYPRLMAASQAEVADFLAQLYLFEHGQPYEPAVIQGRYIGMINAFIARSLAAGRPVYLTMNMEPGIGQDTTWAPEGLAFRLYPDTAYHPHDGSGLELRGLADGTVHLDPVAQQVRRNYAMMTTNRGIYLASYGRHAEAIDAYQRALAIDSAYPLTYRKLGDSFFALGRYAEAADAYQQAVALDPEDVAARQGLEAARSRAQ
jgi:tetratricopeptide (TPR) repeat protein